MRSEKKITSRHARVMTLTWKRKEMVGDLSMKSTLSSANQWKDLRKSNKVKSATNLGEKSSLKMSSRDELFYIK